MYMRGLDSRTNPDVAVIIPSTGRPEQCACLVERVHYTARLRPHVVVSVEPDDVKPYARALTDLVVQRPAEHDLCVLAWDQTGAAGPGSHVAAINRAAASLMPGCPNDTDGDGNCWQCAGRPGVHGPKLIIKLDDDHWPQTPGWDALYLDALEQLGGTGVVYGNDLFQRDQLPTAPGISADIVRELGWYAPPELQHWYCDNFWLELGKRSGRLAYLPDVIMEHRNVQAGKAPDDATYQAGGLNAARIAADEKTWAKILRTPVTDIDGTPGEHPTLRWPSQMVIWADRVIGLAARKGWKP